MHSAEDSGREANMATQHLMCNSVSDDFIDDSLFFFLQRIHGDEEEAGGCINFNFIHIQIAVLFSVLFLKEQKLEEEMEDVKTEVVEKEQQEDWEKKLKEEKQRAREG